MNIKITFLGAAQSVTGSKYLVEVNDRKLLVDCGMFQEHNLKGRNWEDFPIETSSIDAVLLTHAHLDHCGLLPRLVKEGFKGPIYCTGPTIDIAKIVLLDAARIQEEDAAFKKKRHDKEGRKGKFPELPLYAKADAEATFPFFKEVDYEQKVQVTQGIYAVYHEAGHILGSAMIEIIVSDQKSSRRILFSGDLGRKNAPILRDPTIMTAANYVIMESTYGDREIPPTLNLHEKLSEIICSTYKAGGNIVIPSFAVERSQEVLYRLNELLRNNQIPHSMVFLDSPMATRVTEVFRKHPELFDEEANNLIREHKHLCDFPGLVITRDSEHSKAINHIQGSVIIIAGSGMCTGGRIKHHLINNIQRKESTILFVGYQAVGTLGRSIVDGAKAVRILGEAVPVKARICKIDGFSAHADQKELFSWISNFKTNPPQKIILTHGEEKASFSLSQMIMQKLDFQVVIPKYKDTVNLE